MSLISLQKICRPATGLLLLAAIAALRAQTPANAEAAPPVSISALGAEITARNPELKFYEAEIVAAKAGRRMAGTRERPEVSLELGRKGTRDPAGVSSDGTVWSLSVTQTFAWSGRLDLRKAIADRQTELAELGLARFKSALAARARVLVYGLRTAQSQAAATREVADRFALLKATFLARDPAGITPLLETRVIEAAELALQHRATESELALQTALLELNQLRGAAVDAPLRVTVVDNSLTDVPDYPVLLAAAHQNNFGFRMRRVEVEQQGFVVRLAENERHPSLTAGPIISRESGGSNETVVGLSLSFPWPGGERAAGAVEAAEARRRQAEAALLVAQRDLDKEVIMAAQAFATKLAEARRWSADAAGKFREAAELADRHYRLGAVPVAIYVELQNSYLDAVEVLLDNQRETLEAALKLQELTGLNLVNAEVAP